MKIPREILDSLDHVKVRSKIVGNFGNLGNPNIESEVIRSRAQVCTPILDRMTFRSKLASLDHVKVSSKIVRNVDKSGNPSI